MVPSTASGASTSATTVGDPNGETCGNGATSTAAQATPQPTVSAVTMTPQVITYTIPSSVNVGSSLSSSASGAPPGLSSSSSFSTSSKAPLAPSSLSSLMIGVAAQPQMATAALKIVQATPSNKGGDIYVATPRSTPALNLAASVGGNVMGSTLSLSQALGPNMSGSSNLVAHKPAIAVSTLPMKAGLHHPMPASQAIQSPVRTIVRPLTKTLTTGSLAIGSTLLTGQQFSASTGMSHSEHHILTVKQNSIGNPPIILSPSPHHGALAPSPHPLAPGPITVPLNYSATSSRATLNVVATSQSPISAPINFPLQLTSSRTMTSSSIALNASTGQKISVQPNIMQKPMALSHHVRSVSSSVNAHHPHARKQIEINPLAYSPILSATAPVALTSTPSIPSTLPSLICSSTSSIVRSPGGLVTSIPLSVVQPRISSLAQLYSSQEQSASSSASHIPTVIQRTPPLNIKTLPQTSMSAGPFPVVRTVPIKSHHVGGMIPGPLLSPPGSAPIAINNNRKGIEAHQHPQQISIFSSPTFPVTPLTPVNLRHSSPLPYTLPAASVTVKQQSSHGTHGSPRGRALARESAEERISYHAPPHREPVCYGIPHQVYLVSRFSSITKPSWIGCIGYIQCIHFIFYKHAVYKHTHLYLFPRLSQKCGCL